MNVVKPRLLDEVLVIEEEKSQKLAKQPSFITIYSESPFKEEKGGTSRLRNSKPGKSLKER